MVPSTGPTAGVAETLNAHIFPLYREAMTRCRQEYIK